MDENPIGFILRPLVQAAAFSVVGPLAMVVAPVLGALSLWAGQRFGGESEAARAAGEVLSGVFGHLGGDAAKDVFSSLQESGNHDLERSMATAIKLALLRAQADIAPTNQILSDRYYEWFSLWDKHLEHALENTENAAALFYVSDKPDPVVLASITEQQWWSSFKPVLLRWIETERQLQNRLTAEPLVLPPDLNDYLENNLLGIVRQSVHEVLRDKSHQRGWIAWQQQFLEAIAQQTLTSDAAVAHQVQNLASDALALRDELHEYLSQFTLAQMERERNAREAQVDRKRIADEILDALASHGPDETQPHHRLELLTFETENGLVIALNNPENAVREDCRVVLRELGTWSARKDTFLPQDLRQFMILLSCHSVPACGRSTSAYLVMITKANKTELLLQEHVPGGFGEFLTKKGTWKAVLTIEAKRRRTFHTVVFFEWTPGASPRFIPEPKRRGAAYRAGY